MRVCVSMLIYGLRFIPPTYKNTFCSNCSDDVMVFFWKWTVTFDNMQYSAGQSGYQQGQTVSVSKYSPLLLEALIEDIL